MSRVEIYTKSWCPFCARAKAYLDACGVAYEEIDVTTDTVRDLEMRARAGRTLVPQLFIDGVHLGGSDDLVAADRSGELNALLAGTEQGVVS